MGSVEFERFILGWMAGAASNTFFHLPFISLSWYLYFIPNSASAKMHVEGQNKIQV
jgi:hypothetical protein